MFNKPKPFQHWVVKSFAFLLTLQCANAERYSPAGGEYSLTHGIIGDQLDAGLAFSPEGSGWLVWSDNGNDGSDLGIGASVINANMTPGLNEVLVNSETRGLQSDPGVASFSNDSTVFGWLSGFYGEQKLMIRALNGGPFMSGDTQISAEGHYALDFDIISTLSGYLLVWSQRPVDSMNSEVLALKLNSDGEAVGVPFQVNTTTFGRQKSVSVASSDSGLTFVVWADESYLGNEEVNLVGRWLDANGEFASSEIRVNRKGTVCSNPDVTVSEEGNAFVVWAALDREEPENIWDIYFQKIGLDGVLLDTDEQLNHYTANNQWKPSITSAGDTVFAVWETVGQDNAGTEIYAAFIEESSGVHEQEFRVNSTLSSKQMDAAVSVGVDGSFLVAWSSFVGGAASYEILAQRYSREFPQLSISKPIVSAMDSSRLTVAWPAIEGYTVLEYLVQVDGSSETLSLQSNYVTVEGFAPSSEHTFRVAAKLVGGVTTDYSEASTGKTYGLDSNFDGLPDDWQRSFWGDSTGSWGSAFADSDGDGASNLFEFLAGTDPTDAESYLFVRMISGNLGARLEWDTLPGMIYQVEVSGDLENWEPYTSPRFAVDNTDSISLNDNGGASKYFRVVMLR